eukprot:gene2860-15980_t
MELSHSRKHFDLVFDISEAHAQEALRHLTSAPVIPVAKRKNTLCSDATSTLLPNRIVQRGICLGCIAAKAQVPMVANRVATAPYKQAELYLTGMARQYLPKDFFYTSIQLNLNYAVALHTDNNNMGKSFIMGIGNYSGGQLYVETRGTLDIRDKFVAFNGLLPHMTVNIHGAEDTHACTTGKGSKRFVWNDRWSAVFFCNSVASKLHNPEYAEHLQALKAAGYNTPPPSHFDVAAGGDVNRKSVRREMGTPAKMLETAKAGIVAGGGDPC